MVTADGSDSQRSLQLGVRPRALMLQQRRFWREFTYGALTLAGDVLTLAVIFTVLAAIPISEFSAGLGDDGRSFVSGLIPQTPVALARRVTLLVFSLFVTGCYSNTEREKHPARMFGALLLGLVLPRWVDVWQSELPYRWALVAVTLVASWSALVLQRRALVRALRPLDPRRHDALRTLVVGLQTEIGAAVRPGADDRPRPRAFVIEPSWPESAPAGIREMALALAEADADAVVLVGPVSDSALQAVVIGAASAGATVYASRRKAFHDLDEPSFVLRRSEPLALLSRPALVGSQLVVKRAIDFSGALAGLILLSPLWALVATAVKLTSPGPVLFRQRRVGLGGETFELIKFRTMVVGAEQQQAQLAAANVYANDPLFKLPTDPRMTPIGVFLRRSSLDELPQLVNVLRGEMSLVGPRPPLPSEVSRYQQHHFVRFEVLPGVTGPWQVSGRNTVQNFEDVVRLEADYIRGWTVWRDFWILLRTIPAVLSMKGAF